MPTGISIIIPVHNSLEFTKEAIFKLSEALEPVEYASYKFEIIVVDDGSTDGTSEWIKQHFPKIHLCQGDGNLWWSGAINMGMNFALNHLGSAYILWWNNDIYSAGDYFTQLIGVLAESKESVVIGSKIYIAGQPDRIWSVGGVFHKLWGHSFMPGSGCADGPEFSTRREADWLPGMGTVLHREIIQKTGFLNEKEFPQYHGDVDYTYRAKKAGFRIVVMPELKIWNHTSHTGISHGQQLKKLLPTLQETNSIHNLKREWLLYRTHAVSPLAYLMLLKKVAGYFVKFFLGKIKGSIS